MPLLAVRLTRGAGGPVRGLLLGALLFSWLGDVLLLADKHYGSFFLFGLVAFLLAHVAYIWMFVELRSVNGVAVRPHPAVYAGILAYAAAMIVVLRGYAGGMIYAVAVYAAVISVMFLASIRAFDLRRDLFGRICVLGTFLFLVSDSLLAVNRFMYPIPYAPLLVMSTYGLAQFLIADGVSRNAGGGR